MKRFPIATLLFLCLLPIGCRRSASTEHKYQAKYREANLIGEWIQQDRQSLPKNGQYDMDKESLIEDTLVFSYDNEVITRKKTTTHYITFHPEEVWGEYEIVKGKFCMKNDTLIISYDYPNMIRTTFGKDPLSDFSKVYIGATDTIKCYYAIKDLSSNDFTLVHFLRKWKGGSSSPNNVQLKYNRR